jgi:uncharacterized membrane protein YeaQ/YmgE (transglycosylase-associated protein family)
MLVLSWIVVGVVAGAIAHLILRDRGYEWIGEMLVGISAASVSGAMGPVVLGVRTGSVDILSDVGLLCTIVGASIALAVLVWLTPKNKSQISQPAAGR